ncbi:MAG: LytR/AlgR family response regulator transcription factor [Bacillota bacterium]
MLTVMIVDDDPCLRRSLRNAVECIPGTEVVSETGDAAEALWLSEKHRPDCVFIDIDIRRRRGLELARKIIEISPGTHLVFCSGNVDYRQRAAQANSYDYICRPIGEERLRKTIRQIMGERTGNSGKIT